VSKCGSRMSNPGGLFRFSKLSRGRSGTRRRSTPRSRVRDRQHGAGPGEGTSSLGGVHGRRWCSPSRCGAVRDVARTNGCG